MISSLSYLTYPILIIPIIVSVYKIINIIMFKIQKRNIKISSYGFTISIILLIFYYVLIRQTSSLFYISLIALDMGLLLCNSFRDFMENMFVIPIFAYSVFCLVLGNIIENRMLFTLILIIFLPDVIRVIIQIIANFPKK